ncbi:hypothetical protein BH24ACI4_BH24ACI4_13340 [soil metagenome]
MAAGNPAPTGRFRSVHCHPETIVQRLDRRILHVDVRQRRRRLRGSPAVPVVEGFQDVRGVAGPLVGDGHHDHRQRQRGDVDLALADGHGERLKPASQLMPVFQQALKVPAVRFALLVEAGVPYSDTPLSRQYCQAGHVVGARTLAVGQVWRKITTTPTASFWATSGTNSSARMPGSCPGLGPTGDPWPGGRERTTSRCCGTPPQSDREP